MQTEEQIKAKIKELRAERDKSSGNERFEIMGEIEGLKWALHGNKEGRSV